MVEKQLVREGTSRKEIGREAFVERVWRHLEETGRTIMGQYRRLGASLDYERERFTMDDAYIEAVMRFFVHLWGRGWIYRANRIVNWCPFHETAISDLEVVPEPMDDRLTYARYPFTDGSGSITVATVRPATILADVAVAVHPDDERYRDAVGKEVVVPYVERRVPVIADELVDPEFATGALKITPGHDPDRLRDRGRRPTSRPHDGHRARRSHERGGTATSPGSIQAEADKALVAWLPASTTSSRSRRTTATTLGHCERCHTAHRAARSRSSGGARWRSRRKPALEALRERRVRYHPESQHQFAIRSLEEIRRLEHLAAALVGPPAARSGTARTATPIVRVAAAGGLRRVRVRPSSSATRTSSTRGSRRRSGRSRRSAGPRRPAISARYYPGDVDSTAREIICLWVNRMIWSGLELIGDVPFTRRDHPLDRARARRAADVEEPRDGHRPARADRQSTARTRRATGS